MDASRAFLIVTSRLQPGERLIWHGFPTPWRAAIPRLALLGFMTVWTGFAISAIRNVSSKASATDAPTEFAALAIPALFCVIGTTVLLWTLRKIADVWRTAYGLTDRRLIIAVGQNGQTESYSSGAIGSLKRVGNDRRGTLLFGYGRNGDGVGYNAAFYGIEEPARVEALIYQTLLLENAKGATT